MPRNFYFSSAPSPSGVETTAPANARQAPHGAVVTFSRRPRGGGFHVTGANAAKTHGELFRMPAGSLSKDPVRDLLEPPDRSHSLFDIFVGGLTGLALFVASIMLFICQF